MQNTDYVRFKIRDRVLDDISKFNSNAMLVYAEEVRSAADKMWDDYEYARKHIKATPKFLRGIAKERYEDDHILDVAIALDKSRVAFEMLADFLKIYSGKEENKENIDDIPEEDIKALKDAVNSIDEINKKIKGRIKPK